jgi:hypothetical protein
LMLTAYVNCRKARPKLFDPVPKSSRNRVKTFCHVVEVFVALQRSVFKFLNASTIMKIESAAFIFVTVVSSITNSLLLDGPKEILQTFFTETTYVAFASSEWTVHPHQSI